MDTALSRLSIRQKTGQLFMVGMPGPRLDGATEALIRECNPGGVVLFSRNIEGPLQVAALCRELQETALGCHGLPLFLAVDQEGGAVARLRRPFSEFPGNRAIGCDRAPEKEAQRFAEVTAREMALVGLNMDLAPVVDVPVGEPEKHLRGRTFSADPQVVARLGAIVIRTLQNAGIMAVAKHFPGLGRADVDPHYHLPRIALGAGDLETMNMPPFRAAIREAVSGIMTSHALYPALDPERPGTLSSRLLTRFLREKLGYEGLVLTDDLEMGAIAGSWGVARGAAAALQAGADILLICEDQERVREGFERITGMVRQGAVSEGRLDGSIQRILKAKKAYLDPLPAVSLDGVRTYFGV